LNDLPRSLAFYQKLLGVEIFERPPFKSVGAWLAGGALQVHLTLYPPRLISDPQHRRYDCHFAFRTDDFDGALATLMPMVFTKTQRRTTRCVSWSGGRNNGGYWRQRGLGTSRAFQ
jgi:hypothetical protein